MSAQNSDNVNGKRIVKNTIFLYFRMIIMMCITIYTSRVVLDVLGVDDYGIYNVVGGVIVLFAFISNSMNVATQRYLNTAMGKQREESVNRVFNNSLYIYAALSLLILIVGELLGHYLITSFLNIPEPRIDAAYFVYQVSLINLVVKIMRTPYNAMVIAYERMSFFAYTSIVESLLQLVVVWLLIFSPGDKLEIYSVFLCASAIIITFWYVLYCKKHFESSRLKWLLNKPLIKDMLSFTWWNMFGGFADMAFTQGTNVILNIFSGVTLNTAFGLANQIKAAVFSFVANLQLSANPQIIKSYAEQNIKYFTTLIYQVSKFSYFLMLIIAIPVIFNIDWILSIWLVVVPEHTSNFVVLIIILILFDSLQGPLWTAMQANGNIRNYQIVTSFTLLLNLPLAYIALYLGYPPESVIIVQILVKNLVMIVRILYARSMCFISIRKYIAEVILPIAIVSIICVPIIFTLCLFFDNGLIQTIVSTLTSCTLILITVYLLGINREERLLVKQTIKNKIFRRLKK